MNSHILLTLTVEMRRVLLKKLDFFEICKRMKKEKYSFFKLI